MCEPTTIALIISATAAAAAANEAHEAQNAQVIINKQERDAALRTQNDNLAQVGLQQTQATEQASQKVQENNLEAQKAMATARTSAGENGISGLSVGALLSELDGTRAKYNDSIAAGLTDTVNTTNNQRLNIYNSTASVINGQRVGKAPDYVGAGLQIGSAAYSGYKAYNAPPPKVG